MASLIDDAEAPAMRSRLVASLGVAVGAGLLLAASTVGVPLVALVLAVAGLGVGVPPLRRLLPAGTLRAQRGLPSTILIRGISTFSFFGAQAYLPLALVTVRGASVSEAGLALTFATISWTAGSWTQARLMPTWRAPRLIRTGFAVVTLALAVVATVLSQAVPIPIAVLAWAAGGYGMGLLYSSIAQLVLLDAPLEQHGTASASMQLSDVLGSALGTGFGGALVAAGSGAGLVPAVGLAAAFAVVIAAGASGIVVAGRLKAPTGAAVPA
jgi:predicted MFS family arabinose efflux permease